MKEKTTITDTIYILIFLVTQRGLVSNLAALVQPVWSASYRPVYDLVSHL
jgi:hypothetical protein